MKTDMEMVRSVFRAEATELLAALERDFLAFEASSSASGMINGVRRSLHTLKGNALLMGFPVASDVAHSVEDLLVRISQHSLPVTPEVVTLLLQAVDGLRLLIDLVPQEEGHQGPDAPELLRRLSEAARVEALPEVPPEPGSSAQKPEEATAHAAPERTLRVGLDRLDRMLDLTGEIAIARGRLATLLEQADRHSPQALLEAHRESDRLYLDLQELVLKARMVPIGRAFQPFARTLRDLSAATGKLVRLEVSGEEVEVDTTIVEIIRDSLTHLVRNAVDHGIELPSVRRQHGKDYLGTLKLRAFQEAGSIVVEVEDDGAGLSRERIRDRARAMGLLGPSEEWADAELFQLIFIPGFSTAERITELSGRGIGMDVVKRGIDSLRGSVSVQTKAGVGTTLSLRLPLLLSIIEGFSVGVGEDTYVLPLTSVLECVDLPEQERRPGRTGVLNLRGQPLPYLRLRDHFAVEGPPPARESVVIIHHGRGQAGLAVDTLLGQGQTVVKPLGRLFQHLSGVSGSAILGTGRVALILDVPALFERALRSPALMAH